MFTSMFLDDCRVPKNHYTVICRSLPEAVEYVMKNGIPNLISFDHDLDENGTGYDFAKFLTEAALDEKLNFPENFSFQVHSANPVGKKNIESLLNNFLKYKYS